eukprot:gene3369-13402_t
MALSLPIVMTGACLFKAVKPTATWSHAAYLVWGLLLRIPGVGVIRQDLTTAQAVVLNIVFLFGMFVFAIVVGVIGEVGLCGLGPATLHPQCYGVFRQDLATAQAVVLNIVFLFGMFVFAIVCYGVFRQDLATVQAVVLNIVFLFGIFAFPIVVVVIGEVSLCGLGPSPSHPQCYGVFRQDLATVQAVVLNIVFLFGMFAFAIVVVVIGEVGLLGLGPATYHPQCYGVIRQDLATAQAVLWIIVFLFGMFVFAILLGVIGEVGLYGLGPSTLHPQCQGVFRQDLATAQAVVLRIVFLFGMLVFAIVCHGVFRQDLATAQAVVLRIVFLFGMLVFAIVVGVIGEDVKSYIKQKRQIESSLSHLHGHVLLLNWSTTCSSSILRQVAAACLQPRSTFHGRAIVVLTDRPKAELTADVQSALREYTMQTGLWGPESIEVHVRSGKPFRSEDLLRVSAPSAGSVILLHPEGVQGGASAALALQVPSSLSGSTVGIQEALLTAPYSSAPPRRTHMTACSPIAKLAASLAARGAVDRLIAQTSLQPFSASVLGQLLIPRQGRACLEWVEWAGSMRPLQVSYGGAADEAVIKGASGRRVSEGTDGFRGPPSPQLPDMKALPTHGGGAALPGGLHPIGGLTAVMEEPCGDLYPLPHVPYEDAVHPEVQFRSAKCMSSPLEKMTIPRMHSLSVDMEQYKRAGQDAGVLFNEQYTELTTPKLRRSSSARIRNLRSGRVGGSSIAGTVGTTGFASRAGSGSLTSAPGTYSKSVNASSAASMSKFGWGMLGSARKSHPSLRQSVGDMPSLFVDVRRSLQGRALAIDLAPARAAATAASTNKLSNQSSHRSGSAPAMSRSSPAPRPTTPPGLSSSTHKGLGNRQDVRWSLDMDSPSPGAPASGQSPPSCGPLRPSNSYGDTPNCAGVDDGGNYPGAPASGQSPPSSGPLRPSNSYGDIPNCAGVDYGGDCAAVVDAGNYPELNQQTLQFHGELGGQSMGELAPQTVFQQAEQGAARAGAGDSIGRKGAGHSAVQARTAHAVQVWSQVALNGEAETGEGAAALGRSLEASTQASTAVASTGRGLTDQSLNPQSLATSTQASTAVASTGRGLTDQSLNPQSLATSTQASTARVLTGRGSTDQSLNPQSLAASSQASNTISTQTSGDPPPMLAHNARPQCPQCLPPVLNQVATQTSHTSTDEALSTACDEQPCQAGGSPAKAGTNGARSVIVVSPHEACSAAMQELLCGFRSLSPPHSQITLVLPSTQYPSYHNHTAASSDAGPGGGGMPGGAQDAGGGLTGAGGHQGVEFVVRRQPNAPEEAAPAASCPWAWLQEVGVEETMCNTDAVVVLRDPALPQHESDAMVLTTMLQSHEAVRDGKFRDPIFLPLNLNIHAYSRDPAIPQHESDAMVLTTMLQLQSAVEEATDVGGSWPMGHGEPVTPPYKDPNPQPGSTSSLTKSLATHNQGGHPSSSAFSSGIVTTNKQGAPLPSPASSLHWHCHHQQARGSLALTRIVAACASY